MKVIRCNKTTNPNPPAFTVTFAGRPLNAPTGAALHVSCTVYADDMESARIAIYQEYEHLTRVDIKPRVFIKGDIVGLLPEYREQMRGAVPEGREDNESAEIRACYGDDGECWLDHDLHGLKYWNQETFFLIKAADE